MILEWNKSCIELIALYVHPKNSTGNRLCSHLRAIMALDYHSRLGVENKSGRFFAFDKFTLQNLANKSGCVRTNLLYFLYITSEVKEYYEALFLSYRPQTIGSQFHNFSRQIAFTQYSGPSKHAWAFSEIAWNSSDCFESFFPPNNVWIDRPLMPSSDVTHYPKTG